MKTKSFKKVVVKPKYDVKKFDKKVKEVKKLVNQVLYQRLNLPKGWKRL